MLFALHQRIGVSSAMCHPTQTGVTWRWFPVFWIEGKQNPVLWGNFLGQTVFVALLTAIFVNLRRPWRRN
jgi:hypothetical protein